VLASESARVVLASESARVVLASESAAAIARGVPLGCARSGASLLPQRGPCRGPACVGAPTTGGRHSLSEGDPWRAGAPRMA
jgi:hypothetical protein